MDVFAAIMLQQNGYINLSTWSGATATFEGSEQLCTDVCVSSTCAESVTAECVCVCVCVCVCARMGLYMPRSWVWFVCAWYSHLLGCASWCLHRFAGFPVSTKTWRLIEIFVDSNSLPSFKQILMSSYRCVLKSLTANASDFWDFPCKMSLPLPNMTKKKKIKMQRFSFSQDRAAWWFVSRSGWKASNFCCSKWQQKQGMMAELSEVNRVINRRIGRKHWHVSVQSGAFKGLQVENVTLWLVGHEVDVEW